MVFRWLIYNDQLHESRISQGARFGIMHNFAQEALSSTFTLLGGLTIPGRTFCWPRFVNLRNWWWWDVGFQSIPQDLAKKRPSATKCIALYPQLVGTALVIRTFEAWEWEREMEGERKGDRYRHCDKRRELRCQLRLIFLCQLPALVEKRKLMWRNM